MRDRLRLGLVAAGPVRVAESSAALIEEFESLAAELAGRYAGLAPGGIGALRPARELYKSFGIDPTKNRPSSEALLRRVLRDKPLPRILNAVDVCNFLALKFLLPLGLYDAAKLRGEVLLRRGEAGESYPGIRKGDVHLEGRPVLVDSAGPFGNPTSDSFRTRVDPSTRSLWMIIFAPATISRDAMASHVRFAVQAVERHLVDEPGPGRCSGEVYAQ